MKYSVAGSLEPHMVADGVLHVLAKFTVSSDDPQAPAFIPYRFAPSVGKEMVVDGDIFVSLDRAVVFDVKAHTHPSIEVLAGVSSEGDPVWIFPRLPLGVPVEVSYKLYHHSITR